MSQTMTMEKYFTPEIEDIRVGYECEYKRGDGWISHTLAPLSFLEDVLSEAEIGLIRVSYLTKEQIEKEGWAVPSNTDPIGVPMTKNGWKLYMEKEERIITIEFEYDTLYHGECKDINTFRYICKLLNI